MLDSPVPAPKAKVIEGVTGPWEMVIGLEVHAQVATRAKLFSGASTESSWPEHRSSVASALAQNCTSIE